MNANAITRPLTIAPEVVWRDVEGDLVLFDSRTGEYHVLNASASLVWRRIARSDGLAAIIADAAAARPEQTEAITSDIHAFVASATSLGLLET